MTLNVGVLYVVATPIGNLEDISARAVRILQEVDCIAAEDTRTSLKLLRHLGIEKTMLAYHEHNEAAQTEKLSTMLSEGKSIALISDAGTPLISDPGYVLVKHLINKGFSVVPIPGPSALIAALSVSGMATDRFAFEGFLPAKTHARTEKLKSLATETRTLVFYESRHRIQASLADIAMVLPGREITVCRELTKRFETIFYGTTAEVLEWIELKDQQKGEFVLILSGSNEEISDAELQAQRQLEVLLHYLGPSQAAAAVAQLSGMKKKPLYQMALALQNNLQRDE